MKSLIKMTWMEFKLFLRDPASTFFTLAFPLIYLVLYGMLADTQGPLSFDGHSTLDVAVPSLIAVVISITGLMSTTITLATYRERGILRRLRTTPVRSLTVLGALVIVIFIMACLGMALLVLVGRLAYDIQFSGNIFNMLLAFLLSCLGFFSLGFVLAGIMPTVGAASAVANVLVFPMLLLSGAFFPLGMLPDVVAKISKFIPLTYIVDLLRGMWFGGTWADHTTEVIVLSALLVVGVILSARLFRWE